MIVNVGGGSNGNKSTGFVSSRSEPISLTALEKDCFIIPIHSIDRFLPAGVPVICLFFTTFSIMTTFILTIEFSFHRQSIQPIQNKVH